MDGDDASAEAIAAAVAVTRDRGDRFVVNLRAGTDDRHLPVVAAPRPRRRSPTIPGCRGWRSIRCRRPAACARRTGHEIRRVIDAAGIEDHIRRGGGRASGCPVEWLEAIVTRDSLDAARRRRVRRLHGRRAGDEPGSAIRSGRTIGVYNIATIEAARKRGYGAAMTMRIVDDGAAAGCDVAILQASDMGKPIYERLGFRTVVEYMGYVDPASLAPPDARPDR